MYSKQSTLSCRRAYVPPSSFAGHGRTNAQKRQQSSTKKLSATVVSARRAVRYMGASPSRRSVQRLKDRVGELLVPANTAPWDEVRDRLNQQLRGWADYFAYGTRLMAYRAVDNHVYAAVRGFLARRHKVPTRGTRHFSGKNVFEELGVLRLRRLHVGAPPTATR